MKRYDQIPTQTRYDGKQVYKSTIYPPIIPSSTDIVVISNTEDCLDTLAYKYYGDPTYWWVIANVNNLGKGRLSIPAGITLRIPTDITNIINQYNLVNS